MANFFKQFILSPIKTGAIASSSEELARLITSAPNLADAKVIVELGPGNGAFTKKILAKISSDALFFALETNIDFVDAVKKHCPDALVYHDSAINLKTYLDKHQKENCDCIISGLPWSLFDEKTQNNLMEIIIGNLEDNGEFLTFAYMHSKFLPSAKRFRKMLYSKFTEVNTTKIAWNNIPPAFVYHAKK